MPDPLIIAYEDSAEGRDAVALGADLARALQAQPVLARAVALPEGALSMSELTSALEAMAAGQLSEPLAELSELGAEGATIAGTSAARALHELAEDREAIAVVVGSSDRGSVGRIVPGTTAERLLAGSPCAVAVAARGYAEEGTRPLRVAVALDGSPEAAGALRAGEAIARRCNSTLTLLGVAQTVGGYAGPELGTLPEAELQSREERRIREALDGAVGRIGDLPVHTHLLHGAPGQALADVSDDYDLIVVGSRGYGPLRRTLLGSTSRKLLLSSRCSVLAVPRGGELDESDDDPGPAGVDGATAAK